MNENKIPKIIHAVWVGGGEKSDIVKKSMASWLKFCPDYTLMEWNEENFDIENSCEYVKQAYSNGKWAFVSDYIRLKVLYEFGGVYLDTDSELIKNLDGFLCLDGFICIESRYSLSFGIIGTVPKAEWIGNLLRQYECESFIDRRGNYNLITINNRVQRILSENYDYKWSDKIQKLKNGLCVFPSEYFSPINPYTGIKRVTEKTHMIHHYDNTWMSPCEKVKKRTKQIITRMIGEDNRARIAKIIKEHNESKERGGVQT